MRPKQSSPVCELCGFDEGTPNDQHQLPVGTMLHNQYRVGRVLGQGGFGITYIGMDMILDTPVAIKEYYPEGFVHREVSRSLDVTCKTRDRDLFEKHRDRFLQEARILGRLSSEPEIVQVRNFFAENNTAYIVMEYVRGITLKQKLKQMGRPMTVSEALDIMEPVMLALEKVHAHQLIHRDISPDNIMLPDSGGVKLIDFGTARIMDDDGNTKSTEAILKHGFAPLEQYNTHGNLGSWTDVYAVCATLYYLLTGKLPLNAPSRIEQTEELPLLKRVPKLSKNICKVITKGMSIRSADRIQTVGELRTQLYASRKRSGPPKEPDRTPTRIREQKPEADEEKTLRAPKQERSAKTRKREPAAKPVKKRSRRGWGLAAALGIVGILAAVMLMIRPAELFADLWSRAALAVPGQTEGTAPSLPAQDTLPPETEVPETAEPVPAQAETLPQQEAAQGPVELKVAYSEAEEETDEWWQRFEEEFEEAYPNVDLIVDTDTRSGYMNEGWTGFADSGQVDIPHITNTTSSMVDIYREKGMLLPVDQFLSETTYAKFYHQFLDHFERDGQHWAIPEQVSSAQALIVNRKILDELGLPTPTTWDELAFTCEMLMASNSPEMQEAGWGMIPLGLNMTDATGYRDFAAFALNNGGGFVDNTGNWAFNDPQNSNAIRFMKSLVHASLTNSQPENQDYIYMEELILNDRIIMTMESQHLIYLAQANGMDWFRVAPIPTSDGGVSRSMVEDLYSFVVFDRDYTEQQLEAIRCFFDFFYEDQRQSAWAALNWSLPATISGAQQMGMENPAMEPWTDILANAVVAPSEKQGWEDVKLAVALAMQYAVNDVTDPQILLDEYAAMFDG